MSNNKDFKIKNGIKPTVYQETLGTVVSAAEGYYLSGGSYDSVSFSVASQETDSRTVTFNPTGTIMYVAGPVSDKIWQYTLSTAFDISTASYASKDFSFSSQDINLTDVILNDDGTRMWMVGETNNSVFAYSLSTAYDVSTASYDSVSFSVASQETSAQSVAFNDDGTKMYVTGYATDAVYQYSLSTAYDVSTASYDSVSLDISSQDTAPQKILWNPSGTKLYMLGYSSDKISQYNLTTAYDLSTASFSVSSISFNSETTVPTGMHFKPDGSKLFIIGFSPNTVFQYSTALATAQLDLSTGSVFDYTPTSNVQVTLTNPAASGTASGATLLLGSEDSVGVGSTFSTTLYTGTGAAKTISNGLDLSTDGGLVWIKRRDSAGSYSLWDSGRGISNWLSSDSTSAQVDYTTTAMVSFNTDGFTLGVDTVVNASAASMVSWSFKKKTKFFDVVTWTGNGTAGRTISHNLGTTVGCVMIKNTSNAENWMVYHIGSGIDGQLNLNTNAAAVDESSQFNDTVPSSTVLTLGANSEVNYNGQTYVAYLFAHDTDASSIIKCGSYTGTGSANNAVTLGWEPQWLIVKSASGTGSVQNWDMFDNQRGFSSGSNTGELFPNTSIAERNSGNRMNATTTGFSTGTSSVDEINSSGVTYIYMAIRNSSIPTITYDPNLQWSGGTAPTAPAIGETDVITFNTTDGGTTYKSALAIDGAK